MIEDPSEQRPDLDKPLYGVPLGKYGGEFHNHLLEQYKLYVEMADKISERRQSANTFFFTICTALITALGIAWPRAISLMGTVWFVAVAVAGILLSNFWRRLILS